MNDQNSLPSAPAGNFYGADKELTRERERLAGIAERHWDDISLTVVRPLIDTNTKPRILDVAAGAHDGLGIQLARLGCDYIAMDQNPKFVGSLRQQDIQAWQGLAQAMPDIDPNGEPVADAFDLVHTRLALGWNNFGQRCGIVQEGIHALKPQGRTHLAYIEADWSQAEGPEPYMDAVRMAQRILTRVGFRPDYGGELHDDMQRIVGKVALAGTHLNLLPPTIHEEASTTTLREAVPIIHQTALSLIEGLQQHGNGSMQAKMSIDGIRSTLATLADYAQKHGGDTVKIPTLVSQVIEVEKTKPSLGRERRWPRLTPLPKFQEGHDYQTMPGDQSVHIVTSREMRDTVRQMQAREYLLNGLISEQAINKEGMLSESNYPQKLVNNSVCITIGTPDDPISASLSGIFVNQRDGLSFDELPAIKNAGLTKEELAKSTGQDPEKFDADGVVELTSLLRNSLTGGHRDDLMRAIDGIYKEASRHRDPKDATGEAIIPHPACHTAVMTLQEEAFMFIQGMIGKDNMTVLRGPHVNNTPGVSPDVKYITLAITAEQYARGASQHS